MNTGVGNNDITRNYYNLSIAEKRQEFYDEFYELIVVIHKLILDKYPNAQLPSLADLANIRTAGVVSSWQEEDETTYNALLTLLGSENVGLIPYVYNSEYTGNYIGALATSGTMVSIRLPSGMSYSTEFKAAFIAAAVVNGFTDESSGTTYKATKMIGEKRILIQFVGQNSLGITYKVPNA